MIQITDVESVRSIDIQITDVESVRRDIVGLVVRPRGPRDTLHTRSALSTFLAIISHNW